MELSALLEQLSSVKVLVIGDVMLDHYIWGDVHRISPEAPVPVVSARSDSYTAGGAANVALNLANLRVQTRLMGYWAADEAGNRLQAILKDKKVALIDPPKKEATPTIIKTRVVVRNQQLCRIDREMPATHYKIEDSQSFPDLLDQALQGVDAVLVSDYAKGVITQSLVDQLVQKSEGNKKFLLAVDPKPSRHLKLHKVGLITPNRNEALELAGLKLQHEDEGFSLDEVCSVIHQKHLPEQIFITLGAEGMAICRQGKVIEKLPTEAKEVFDVSGAGDTVIATLTAALAAGAPPQYAARLANAAAGWVVGRMGTVPIEYAPLAELLKKKYDH